MSGTPRRISIITGDSDTRELLHVTLTAAGYATYGASACLENFPPVPASLPDLVLLDHASPGINSAEFYRDLKKRVTAAHVGVVMLVTPEENGEGGVDLEAGTEEYLLKPFSTTELLLRVRLALKRAGGQGAFSPALRVGGLALKPAVHGAVVDGIDILLTATEFRLLENLLRHRGRVRTREQLLNQVWGYSVKGYARTVDTHVRRLRQKLGCCADMIETVRSIGYRFRE